MGFSIFSQLHEKHFSRRWVLFFSSFSVTVHQPLFDPLECIKHSQIKRMWQGIYKQPHYILLGETLCHFETYSARHLFCFIFQAYMFSLSLPTWNDYMMHDVLKLNIVYVLRFHRTIIFRLLYFVSGKRSWSKSGLGRIR